jgi:excisionase family DNA binding protein
MAEKAKYLTDDELLAARKLLRPDEVADILRVSRSQVYCLIDNGRLRAVRTAGPLRIFTDSVVALLIEADQ